MKHTILLAALLCAACHVSAATKPSEPEHDGAAEQTLEVHGLAQPESAVHDPVADVYLVSNVAGSPFEKDGEGFISRISSAGELLDKAWIVGLDAPKGMALQGELLAVADLTVLRRFQRSTGAVVDVIEIPGASFLNDVTSAPDGSFLVSDSGFQAAGQGIAPTGSDAIYRVTADGAVSRLAAGTALSLPNGLVFAGNELLVAPFGAAKLLRFGADGTSHGELQLPAGQLDGIVALADGCVLVSSLEAAAVLHGRLGGSFEPLLEVVAMDIGLDARRNRLLMPLMTSDTLRILPLASASACR